MVAAGPRAAAFAFVLVASACGGGGGGDDDPGDDHDTTPILDRAPRIEHTCAIATDVTVLAQNQSPSGHALTRVGDAFLLALGGNDVMTGMTWLDLAELRFDPVEIAAPPLQRILGWGSSPSVADRGATMGFAWIDVDQNTGVSSVRIRILDPAGAIVAEPPEMPLGAYASWLELVATDTGYALLVSDAEGTSITILDEDGAPVAGGNELAADAYGATLVRHGDGFIATWSDQNSVHAVRLDATGARASTPVRLSPAPREGTSHSGPFAIALDDRVVVSWVERYFNGDYENPRGHSIIRIALVDATGARVGGSVRLQAAVDERVNIGVSLARVGDAVAVAWSQGAIIHVCGGCITDYTKRLVLFDPDELVPVSNVVELVGPSGLGGPPIANAGGDIGLFLTVDYHALADLAAARVRCTPAP
jgi:hypothetical protein